MAQDNEKMNGLDGVNSELKRIELELKKQELDIQREREKNKKRIITGICGIVALLIVIIVVMTNMQAREEAEKLALEQEEQFQNQMQSLYDDGVKYLDEEKYSEAIESFSQITLDAVCYNDAKKQIELCKSEYLQSVLDEADAALTNLEYAKAINVVRQGMEYFTDSNELINKEQEILNLYAENVKNTAIEYGNEGNYAAATDVLDEYLQFDGNNTEVVGLKNEYGKQSDIQKAYSMRDEGRYVEAISAIKSSAYMSEEELQILYAEVVGLYKDYVLGQVSSNIDSNGYDYAISQLETAQSYLANDADILTQINKLEAEKITKEGITGHITAEKQVDTYEFTSSAAGNYRFEIEDDNAQASYKLIITDRTGNELRNRVVSASDGTTVEFDANSKYSIALKQYSGFANYTIKIYMPNEAKAIDPSAQSLSGSIYYEDQIDSYEYIPQVSGVYRFDVEDDTAGTSYKFVMQDSRGESLRDSVISQDNGKNVELVAGERYTIDLEQYSGFANYVLIIGIPRAPETISGSSFSGTITYEKQEDTFIYVAPVTGKYIFTVSDNNNSASYKFKVLDSRGESLRDSVFSASNEKKVDLEAGNTYTIIVKQYSDFASYTVNISY